MQYILLCKTYYSAALLILISVALASTQISKVKKAIISVYITLVYYVSKDYLRYFLKPFVS